MSQKRFAAALCGCLAVLLLSTGCSRNFTPNTTSSQTSSLSVSTSSAVSSSSVVSSGYTVSELEQHSQEIQYKPVSGAQFKGYVQAPKDYFKDALFIGDSRTVGLYQKSDFKSQADGFCKVSMSVYRLFSDSNKVAIGDLGEVSLETLLHQKIYGKIYLMLGINDIGYGADSVAKQTKSIIKKLRQLQPRAIIYLQANLHVTQAKSDSHALFNNTNLNQLNEQLKSYADNLHVFYLDVNPVFDDENGALRSGYSGDGIHVGGAQYAKWARWISQNTVPLERTFDLEYRPGAEYDPEFWQTYIQQIRQQESSEPDASQPATSSVSSEPIASQT